MSAARHLSPALENGAVMTREEFHRLYAECEGYERVELIEGIVYMPSPIKWIRTRTLTGWFFSGSGLTRHH